MKTYPESIMRKVRQYMDLESNDTSKDEEIMQMSKDEVFDTCCEWEGLIRYGSKLRGWVESIYEIEL